LVGGLLERYIRGMTKITASRRILKGMAQPRTSSATPAVSGADGLYERDLVAWLNVQVALIRDGQLDRIDLANIAEELESMSRSEKRAIYNRLIVLLHHLLKHAFQPDRRSASWRASIVEARQKIAKRIDDSPSLAGYPAELLEGGQCFQAAVERAMAETGLPRDALPDRLPWTAGQVLDRDFWPER